MSNRTITFDYDCLEISGRTIGNLQHCSCCGVREFAGFQEDFDGEDDLYDTVWDWFHGTDDNDREKYGLKVIKNKWGGQDYPRFVQLRAKFMELFPEAAPSADQHLDDVCYALSTIGTGWTPPTAITILALVENWDNAYPIMDALVEGGWQLSVDTVLNTNSNNDISLWTYRRKEVA